MGHGPISPQSDPPSGPGKLPRHSQRRRLPGDRDRLNRHPARGARVHILAVAIDTVVPMRGLEARGIGRDRDDCMRQFRAAWEKFSADPARLAEFLDANRSS